MKYFTVKANSDHEQTLHFEQRRVEIRVVDLHGEPVSGKWLELRKLGPDGQPAARGKILSLDADGRSTLEGSWRTPCEAVLWLDPPNAGPAFRNKGNRRHAPIGRIAMPPGLDTTRTELQVDLNTIQ